MPVARRALLTVFLAVAAGAAQAAETWRHVVLRDGAPVGSALVHFEQDADRLVVTTDVHVRVGIGILTLYEYRHAGREVWQGDRLLALDTQTDDNGLRMAVSGRLTAQGFRVEGTDGVVTAPPDIRPFSFWREDAMGQPQLLDCETGRIVGIATTVLGRPGAARQSYRVAGQLDNPMELTYAGGRLVVARLRKFGSDIEFRAHDVPGAPAASGADE